MIADDRIGESLSAGHIGGGINDYNMGIAIAIGD